VSGAGRTASLCGVAQEVRRCPLPCGDSDWGAAVGAPARTVARRGDFWAIKMINDDYLSRRYVFRLCRESSVKSIGSTRASRSRRSDAGARRTAQPPSPQVTHWGPRPDRGRLSGRTRVTRRRRGPSCFESASRPTDDSVNPEVVLYPTPTGRTASHLTITIIMSRPPPG